MKTLSSVISIVALLALTLTLAPATALAQTEVVCDSDVVVQADDWLSKLADKFYGDLFVYPAIAAATNAKAASDSSYATINNVNVIEPGWKLCIPSADDAQALLGQVAAEEVSFADIPEPEIKVLPLHYQPDVAFAPVSVAIAKGWFEEVGFESVETKSFTAGALAGEALLAGEIFMWSPGNVPVISMRHNGLPVVVVGNLAKAPVEKLVVRPDAGVENPEDLYNIRIGLLEGSTASAVLDNLATYYGLDASRLEVVNLPPPEQLTALTNNEIQAIVVWAPFNYRARDELGAKFFLDNNVSHFAVDDGTPVSFSHTRSPYVFTEDFIRENPNTVRAIMAVMLRAQEFVANPANRAEAIRIHAEMTDQPVELVELGWDDFGFNPNIDASYVEDMQNYTDFLAKVGRIENPIDPLEYVYTDILAELRPQYVITEGKWKP